jgi:hypothetical protein
MNTIHRENFFTATRGAAVVAACTAVAAAFFGLTACESSSPGGKIEASTSSAVASSWASPGATTPAQGQFSQLAVQILDAIVRGDSTTATAHFDRTMRQELTPDKLASNRDTYQQILGSYQSHGDPRQIPLGHLTIVNIPLTMQEKPGQFRVAFRDKDGAVAGLYFLKAGVPDPTR